MEPTRRPEDEVQLNKTPAEQEEPEYSLEEIMNEFGGWTKREEQAAEPGETVRLASPAGRAPDAPASEEDESLPTPSALRPSTQRQSLSRSAPPSGPIRANRIRSQPQLTPEKRVNAPVPSAGKGGRPRSAAVSSNASRRRRPAKSVPPSSLSTSFLPWRLHTSSIPPPPASGCGCC
ncbi:MAG: hypothetical protein ACLTGM_10120 [Oscillospiraceae bacterium]